MKNLWGDSHFDSLLKVFRQFDVLMEFPQSKMKEVIIPCLLDDTQSEGITQRWKVEAKDSTVTGRIYNFPFKPFGVFNNLFLKFCEIPNSSVDFWSCGLFLVLRETVMLALMENTSEGSDVLLKVKITGPEASSISICCSISNIDFFSH